MIENGQISHKAVEDSFRSWRFENAVIDAIATATFATILSYQVAAIVTDVLVGTKPRGQAKSADIGSLLLAQEGSPMSIARAILKVSHAARFYIKKPDPAAIETRESKVGIKSVVVLKLLLLVSIAPIANLLAVALTVERDQFLSFKDVGFGGMGFGINDNFSFLYASHTYSGCEEYTPKIFDREQYVARFFTCFARKQVADDFSAPGSGPQTPKPVSMEIQTNAGAVVFSLQSQRKRVFYLLHASIVVDDKLYRLHQTLTIENGGRLMDLAENRLLTEICRKEYKQKKSENLTTNGNNFLLKRTFSRCHENIFERPERFEDLEFPVTLALTLVNTNHFYVAREEEAASSGHMAAELFYSGEALPIVKRRRSIASSALLGVMAAMSIVVRLTLKLLTKNDLDNGFEILIKEELKMSPYDSMLQCRDSVSYACALNGAIGEQNVCNVHGTSQAMKSVNSCDHTLNSSGTS